jgi:beta-N-acetylhexosaminidase
MGKYEPQRHQPQGYFQPPGTRPPGGTGPAFPGSSTFPPQQTAFMNPPQRPPQSQQGMRPPQGFHQSGFQQPGFPSSPPPSMNPHQKPPKRRFNGWMVLALSLCAVLLIAGAIGFILQQAAPGGGLGGITNNNNSGETSNGNGTPQATATQTEHQRFQQLAAQYVGKMSLDDLIAQLMFVTDDPQITTDEDLDYMIQTQHIGGVLMALNRFDQVVTNYTNDPVTYPEPAVQLKNIIQHWTQETKVPLFVANEDEGGYVRRMRYVFPDYSPPSALAIAQTGDPANATKEGTQMAQHLNEITFNTTFTPVSEVCVLTNGYLDYNERCFGNTLDQVTKYVGPYLSAMQKEGIIGTLKHFPGTGRVDQADDPHAVLPTINDVTKEEYYNVDMAPFKYFVQSQDALEHPGFIMTTYVSVPSIDPDYPAQYSSKFVDGILRKEFGYDGVVITDSLTVMQGNQINGQVLTLDQSSVAALKAGDDMLLGITSSDQVDLVKTAIKEAIQKGELTQERVKESATRVITLKLERKLMTEASLKG